MIGQTLGQYRIVEQAGMGGMATVYKAYQARMDRYVAVKVLPQQYASEPRFIERFTREAKAIAKLDHPHILPVYDFGEENGIAYLVMRYIAAGTVADRIKAGPLPFTLAMSILEQTASALDYAHEQGVLHRDVKSSNILLDERDNAYLTDFGIAKIVEETVDLTRTGGLLGTPAYMSPEQCEGAKGLAPAADQYSLGVVLYEMITGRTPYQAETPMALLRMHLMSEPIPLPRSLRPDLPEGAERVILKALARDPESRYKDCSGLIGAFRDGFRTNQQPKTAPQPLVAAPEVKAPASFFAQEKKATTDRIIDPEPGNIPVSDGNKVSQKRKLPAWVAMGLLAFLAVSFITVTRQFSGVIKNSFEELITGRVQDGIATREPADDAGTQQDMSNTPTILLTIPATSTRTPENDAMPTYTSVPTDAPMTVVATSVPFTTVSTQTLPVQSNTPFSTVTSTSVCRGTMTNDGLCQFYWNMNCGTWLCDEWNSDHSWCLSPSCSPSCDYYCRPLSNLPQAYLIATFPSSDPNSKECVCLYEYAP